MSVRFGQACVSWEGSGGGLMEQRWGTKGCCLTAQASGNTAAPCPNMTQVTGPPRTVRKEETSSALIKK